MTDLSEVGPEYMYAVVDAYDRRIPEDAAGSAASFEPIRKRFGKDVTLVTPGIRPQWATKGDQKRVFTPAMAMEAGSNYLVIGRPISQNENPADAFDKIIEEIQG